MKEDEWGEMINKLARKIGPGGIIKPHPSFTATRDVFKKFKLKFKEVLGDSLEICPSDIFIEIEMLYEPKTLYGDQSSLELFANHFGSVYKRIKLF